ncbi:DNA-methyltransferase [Bradyrhizobium elkanii]|uniref:DNA-methyltransferase n=1 Tax=Bradyrhizobium elkanii TaxID=29448 RepID=UPI003D1E265A
MRTRIIHGDCITELKKLDNRSVDLVLTDPPYGNAMAYGTLKRSIVNDDHPLHGLLALHECWRIQRCNRAAYFFLDVRHVPIVEKFVTQYTDYRVKDWIVWNKQHFGMGVGFRKQHELILVLAKGKPRFRSTAFPNVLTVPRETTEEHPHKKPLPLLKQIIEHSSDPGDTVLDPFAGSGSTLVAAVQAGRNAIGIELEERYVRVVHDRVRAAASP